MTSISLRRRKGTPVPVTFAPEEDTFIRDICENTGLSKADVVRRACRFSLPKFMSGQVSPADLSSHHK